MRQAYRSYSPKPSNYKPRSLRRIEKQSKQQLIISILLGLFLIYALFTWGLPALIGALSIFNHSSKTTQQVQSIADNPAIAPPVLNIPYEATNTATIKINGYASPNNKVEIYLEDQLKDTVNTDDSGNFTSDDIGLSLGTNNITAKTVDSAGNKSLPSKDIQVQFSNDQPQLDVSAPTDGQQIHGGDKNVAVSGTTDPADSVNINGITAIVQSDGTFSKTIPINEGDNTITITATNQYGSTTQVQRKVTYSDS